MQAVKGKGTRLERRLFAKLAGMRVKGWRKNAIDIEGKPDVVFPYEKLALFIDGCFWHGCPVCKRKLPETNHEYWVRKINRNIELTKIHNKRLADEGWTVIRIWEHEIADEGVRRTITTSIRQALNKEQSQ
ncbi:MAG: very short patch repair endonuclease [Anaerolineaceae bacterium]|nr:very short patch repair endonuclease [Anaerolineaceae bacterium]